MTFNTSRIELKMLCQKFEASNLKSHMLDSNLLITYFNLQIMNLHLTLNLKFSIEQVLNLKPVVSILNLKSIQ